MGPLTPEQITEKIDARVIELHNQFKAHIAANPSEHPLDNFINFMIHKLAGAQLAIEERAEALRLLSGVVEDIDLRRRR